MLLKENKQTEEKDHQILDLNQLQKHLSRYLTYDEQQEDTINRSM